MYFSNVLALEILHLGNMTNYCLQKQYDVEINCLRFLQTFV